jgi:putative ABC transport system ATP-binding protein
VGIHGPSGSGKTTFLNLISGLITVTSGRLSVNGTELSTLTEAKRDRFRANHVGTIFQTFNLVDGYTALENVMLGQVFLRGRSDKAKALAMLDQVGLSDRVNHIPSTLSVGQQQRVCIARALVNDPDILLADEPTGSLDPETSAAVMDLILECSKGRTLLLVSHDPVVLERFENRLSLLEFRP